MKNVSIATWNVIHSYIRNKSDVTVQHISLIDSNDITHSDPYTAANTLHGCFMSVVQDNMSSISLTTHTSSVRSHRTLISLTGLYSIGPL